MAMIFRSHLYIKIKFVISIHDKSWGTVIQISDSGNGLRVAGALSGGQVLRYRAPPAVALGDAPLPGLARVLPSPPLQPLLRRVRLPLQGRDGLRETLQEEHRWLHRLRHDPSPEQGVPRCLLKQHIAWGKLPCYCLAAATVYVHVEAIPGRVRPVLHHLKVIKGEDAKRYDEASFTADEHGVSMRFRHCRSTS